MQTVIIIGAVLAISGGMLFLVLMLRKAGSKLKAKDSEIATLRKSLASADERLHSRNDELAEDLSASENFFGNLIQAADDGIAFYDEEMKLVFANNAFFSIIGLSRESYLASDSSAFFHPEDKGYLQKCASALSEKGYYDGELRLRHADGHYVYLSTRSVVIRDSDGKNIGNLTISRDITALRKYHEELIQAKVEAETGNKLKASFLANISHEIRTPLNSVVGFANLLLSDDLTRSTREEYIDHINHNSEKLLQIIGDIIDLSRLESSQIEITYEEASLAEILNEVIEESRKTIKRNEKPIILSVKNNFGDNGDLIFTDKLWLRRVLNHLMDNAIKFTLEGSVELSYSREEENLLFSIKDTGIGIKKENLSRIFEQFRQEIDGHHRPFEGLGVGLTLAKEVIQRMGGGISVQSEKGVGSEFSFTIPYRPAGSSRIRTKDATKIMTSLDWSKRTCLLVDDNKDVLIYLNRILLDTGINIIMARSGIEAIGILKSNPGVDVVLLDMQMPEMNGIEVTREIRKIRKALPIIAQTAFIFEDDKDIILEAGCDACLIKPIRKDHLLTVMSGFIKNG
ncbi:MAG TPA: ATP-binding protein [Bacteroidales bacterium]|nr:ATP-binding protein [Bacteroidales bacterium]